MTKARILVVEDEVIVARDLQRTLTRLGYDVPAIAASGEEAVERVAATKPDLVLMDIHLSGEMDGIAAADQIRQRDGLPVVFLTAYSDEATFRRAQITAPYGYVLKPFEERELEIAVDIALYRHRVESKLRRMEDWLATTLRSIGDAVIATDLAGLITFMNERAEALTGWSAAAAAGCPLHQVLRLVREADHSPLDSLVERVRREEVVIEIGPASLLLARDGAELPVDDSAAPIRDQAGNITGFVIVFRDISVRKQVEDDLRYSAVHDALTGLPNRALLMDRLAQAFELSRRRPEHQFAVLYLDLDHLKLINDSLGHLAGDQVLISVARRLEDSLRSADTVARLGGDEFVILLSQVSGAREAVHVAERIQQSMLAPIRVDGRDVTAALSLGIALSGPGYAQPEHLLRDADAALYKSKALGKGQYVLFDAGLHAGAVELLEMETGLGQAVAREEFRVHYQPIVWLASGQVRGYEALLRWQHPRRGLLLPADFLELAEETGQLMAIGQWVLRQACRQAQAWPAPPGAPVALSVSVNLSHKQFWQPGLMEQVAGALAETGLGPGRLCLEMTEGVIGNGQPAIEILQRLHGLGVQLHLDDFGAGYSSLSMLHHAPLDRLKIGRSLIQPLAGPAAEREPDASVRTLLILARELHLPASATGIETNEQAGFLQAFGCEYGQGFLYGRGEDLTPRPPSLKNGKGERTT